MTPYEAFLNDLDGSCFMAFLLAWRMGDPVTDELAGALLAEARMISDAVSGQAMVDKRLAALLLDTDGWLWNPNDIYSEAEIERLQDIWLQVMEILREGLTD